MKVCNNTRLGLVKKHAPNITLLAREIHPYNSFSRTTSCSTICFSQDSPEEQNKLNGLILQRGFVRLAYTIVAGYSNDSCSVQEAGGLSSTHLGIKDLGESWKDTGLQSTLEGHKSWLQYLQRIVGWRERTG